MGVYILKRKPLGENINYYLFNNFGRVYDQTYGDYSYKEGTVWVNEVTLIEYLKEGSDELAPILYCNIEVVKDKIEMQSFYEYEHVEIGDI